MVKFRIVYTDSRHQEVEAEDYIFSSGFVNFRRDGQEVLSIAVALVESIALGDVPEAE